VARFGCGLQSHDGGLRETYRIVVEDEAEPSREIHSYVSTVARSDSTGWPALIQNRRKYGLSSSCWLPNQQ
jgi:hypothetical protein